MKLIKNNIDQLTSVISDLDRNYNILLFKFSNIACHRAENYNKLINKLQIFLKNQQGWIIDVKAKDIMVIFDNTKLQVIELINYINEICLSISYLVNSEDILANLELFEKDNNLDKLYKYLKIETVQHRNPLLEIDKLIGRLEKISFAVIQHNTKIFSSSVNNIFASYYGINFSRFYRLLGINEQIFNNDYLKYYFKKTLDELVIHNLVSKVKISDQKSVYISLSLQTIKSKIFQKLLIFTKQYKLRLIVELSARECMFNYNQALDIIAYLKQAQVSIAIAEIEDMQLLMNSKIEVDFIVIDSENDDHIFLLKTILSDKSLPYNIIATNVNDEKTYKMITDNNINLVSGFIVETKINNKILSNYEN